MMTTFVTTPSSASRFRCVTSVVAAQPPGNLALTDGPSSLAYGELNCRANRLACHLRSLGVRADVLVGLCLPRTLDMVVGALGILKAGGAYVPMDPEYPADRLAFMLDDAQAPVLITAPSVARRLPTTNRAVVYMDAPQIAGCPDRPPVLETAPSDLVYVIYTSGSTGTPKGVEITHGNLTNLISWHQEAFSVTAADRASHLAGLGFDAAVWELWPYLATGASVHLAHDVARTAPERLRDWLVTHRITISFAPTPLAERLLTLEWPRTSALRILLTGGDTLRRYPPPTLPFVFINNYGPTECAVVATSGRVESDKRVDVLPPIGRAVANAEVYILDERLDHAAAGTPGEIYIGGAGVARGYRNRQDLTAEKFVSNPFSVDPDSRLFRTGDLGRFLPDGQIGFLGRVDDQIKIRGYRIEPNEIVGLLNRRPEIRQSIVVAREDTPDDRRLIAYLVMAPDASVTHTGLREFLGQSLPDYMLPTAFVRLDRFPLTTNGKIDRAALPRPSPTNTVLDPVSPVANTPVERRTAKIVAGVLGLEEVGRDDNFFLLGGHSLLGAQLITRLQEAFGVEIALRSLFAAPTVAGLASEIELLAGARGKPAPHS